MSEHMQNYYGSLCTEMYEIREIRPEEYPLLDDFLYEAIYIPENVEAPPRDIIEQPDLQVYVADFGKRMITPWWRYRTKQLSAPCGAGL